MRRLLLYVFGCDGGVAGQMALPWNLASLPTTDPAWQPWRRPCAGVGVGSATIGAAAPLAEGSATTYQPPSRLRAKSGGAVIAQQRDGAAVTTRRTVQVQAQERRSAPTRHSSRSTSRGPVAGLRVRFPMVADVLDADPAGVDAGDDGSGTSRAMRSCSPSTAVMAPSVSSP